MNVFEVIYLNNEDPIERSFIAAETALDIAIASINRDYELESGLFSLNTDGLFTEDAKENIFVKFVKGIFNAIRNFFSTIVEAITDIFGDSKISENDKSKQIKLGTDIEKLGDVTDREIRRGNKLLKKISSSDVADSEIDGFIESSTQKIKSVGPVVITVAAALGLKGIVSGIFKKHNEALNEGESISLEVQGSNDSKKETQKKKIINHISRICREVGGTIKSATLGVNKQFKQAVAEAEKDYKDKKANVDSKYSAAANEYAKGSLTDDEFHTTAKSLAAEETDLKETLRRQVQEADTERKQKIQAIRMMDSVLAALEKRYNRKVMSKIEYDAAVKLIKSTKSKYDNGSIDFNTYGIQLQHYFKK